MSMVKALTEIVLADIGPDVVSMSIVQKQNQSGFKFNERLFILVHGVFFGYISKVKMTDNPNSIAISQAKVKIPIKNLYSAEVDELILKIKFTVVEEGKVMPKEWILKLASEKLATLWKQYLDFEIKQRSKSKSPAPNKGGNTARSSQSPLKKPGTKQELQKSKDPPVQKPIVRQQTKRDEDLTQIDKNKKQNEVVKPEQKPTKVFQNPLFQDEGSQSQEDTRRKTKRNLSKNKQDTDRSKKSGKQPEIPKKTQPKPEQKAKVQYKPKIDAEKSKSAIKQPQPQKNNEVKQPDQEKKVDNEPPQDFKKKTINLKPLQIKENPDQNQRAPPQRSRSHQKPEFPVQITQPNKQSKDKPIDSSTKDKHMDSSTKDKPTEMSSKDKHAKQNKERTLSKIDEDFHEQTPKFDADRLISPNKMVTYQQKPKSRTNADQQIIKEPTKTQKQIQFLKQVMINLQEKNKKVPISQIVYDHDEIQKMSKIYGDKLGPAKKNDRTEMLLNHIIDNQKNKLSKDKMNKKQGSDSWIFLQFAGQESQILLKFEQHCNRLMKQLNLQLHNKQYNTFQKVKEEKNIMYLKSKDIDIKVPLISFQAKGNNMKLLDKTAIKIIRKEFKNYQYLYKIIANRGSIRVPLSCLCEYGGLTALFKVSPIFYTNDKVNIDTSKDISRLQQISNLPISKLIPSYLKPLNEFHYNQMRDGDNSISFKYMMIDELSQLFAYDLNQNLSPVKEIRMELIEQQVSNSILPAISQLDLDVISREDRTNVVEKLSKKIQSKIQKLASSLNNLDVRFIQPKQLSKYMHSVGINARYLGSIYKKVNDQFVRSQLLSEMVARTIKTFLSKTLQDDCIEQSSSKLSQDQLYKATVDKIVDFLNCLFENNSQSQALWQIISKNCESYFKVSMATIQQLNKGQLIISTASHCGIPLYWRQIDTSLMFKTEELISNYNIGIMQVITKSYRCQSTQLYSDLKEKMKLVNQENFKWMVNTLELKKQKLPKELKMNEMSDQVRLYLSNFIEPEQLDWSNNFSHLAIYETGEPSTVNFQIDLAAIRWSLKTGNKFKYLGKFNQLTNKVGKLYGSNHPILSQLYELFSDYHKAKGEIEDCISFEKSSILNLSALSGDSSPKVAEKYYKLAIFLLNCKRTNEASQYLRKSKQILDLSPSKKLSLYGNIKLNIALILFKQEKYNQVLQQLQSVCQCFQTYQRQETNSYEVERMQVYQMLYFSHNKLNRKLDNLQLCNSLEGKLKYFPTHSHFQEVLWMIVEHTIINLAKNNQQAIYTLWNKLPTRPSITYYKKAYELLKRRHHEGSLIENIKKYTQNATTIVSMIEQKGLLQDWENLKIVYERQTLFDFISLIEELIYSMGRDRLNTINLA